MLGGREKRNERERKRKKKNGDDEKWI